MKLALTLAAPLLVLSLPGSPRTLPQTSGSVCWCPTDLQVLPGECA
jgi:hypothetical protein